MAASIVDQRRPVAGRHLKDILTGVLTVLGIFGVALALRLPYLTLVPTYTDEGVEALWALDIALGRHLPLTGADAYYGPLYYYLLAGLFWLFGPTLELPRLVAAVFGAATAVAAFGLGWLLFGQRAGLVAAGLVATSPVMVIQSGHQGWSNSLTPFFMTATVLALTAAFRWERPWLLLVAGVLAGATVQAHPTKVVGIAGMAAWVLTTPQLWRWFRAPSFYTAIVTAFAAYSPVIVATVQPESILQEQVLGRPYAFDPVNSVGGYLLRTTELARNVAYGVGAGPFSPNEPVRMVLAAISLVLLGAGLVLLWRRGDRCILWIYASTIVLLPSVVKSTSFRYSYDLFPLGCVAIGGLAAAAMRRGSTARLPHDLAGWSGRRLPGWVRQGIPRGIVALVAVQMLVPLLTIPLYLSASVASGAANTEYQRLAGIVRASGACADGVLVNPLRQEFANVQDQEAPFAVNALTFVLTMQRCRLTTVDTTETAGQLERMGGSGWLLMPSAWTASLPDGVIAESVAVVTVPMLRETVAMTFARVHLRD